MLNFKLGVDYNYDDVESKEFISETTEFDGTNYIDTNTTIMDKDRDFTFAIDFEFNDGNTSGATLAQCFQSNGSNGFRLWYSSNVNLNWGTKSTNPTSIGNREVVVIRHKAGSEQAYIYCSNLTGNEVSTTTLAAIRIPVIPSTLVFGCSKADDGEYEKYAKGKIHWAKLWYADLGENECKEIAAWVHETIPMMVATLLYSFDMSMTEEDAQHIIEQVKTSIGLDQYIKAADVNKLLDDIVGNLEDKDTVVDYINSLSYNKLSDKPIENLIGSLNAPVYISSLADGIYKIKGQYIISQSNPTVQSSAEDVLFFVSHDPELEKKMTITKMQGTSIVLYFLQTDGTYRTDKYVTENWIADQNFMSADSAKELITETIQESVANIVDQQLDAKLDSALDKKLGGISTEELTNIFK